MQAAMDKTLELTIDLGGYTTRMRFNQDSMIPEVLSGIQEKLNKKEVDMGIFRPESIESGRPSMWLPYGKPLREFQIKATEIVFYKKRQRPLRYQLIDGTAKMVMIDDAATVEMISHKIGDHIGLKNHDEFGLRYPEDKTSWLDPVQTLQQLRVHPDKVLLYARRFFGETLDLADPFQLQLFFIESNKAILEDELPCIREEAVHFAALQLQITFGDYNPQKHKPGWLNKAEFLPLHWQKDKKIESSIYKDYKKLAGMTAQAAKYRYYNDMRQMKSFGTTFFTCVMYFDDKKKKQKQRLIKLGISREKFVVLDLNTREPLHDWLFTWHKSFRLKTLQNGESVVFIDFGDHLPPQLVVKSPNADQIGKLISGYIDLLLKAPQEASPTGLPEDFFHADEETMENAVGFSATGVTTATTAGYFRGPNNTSYHPPSQRVNIANITSAQRSCSLLSNELGSTKGFVWVNPSELTLENAKIQFNSDKHSFASAVDDLLGTAKFNPGGLKRRDVDLKSQQLAAQVKGIAARARSLAAFDDGPSLIGAKAVAEAIANMFQFLDQSTATPEAFPPMALYNYNLEQAEKCLHRSQMLLSDINKIYVTDEGAALMMLDFVKEIHGSFNHMIALGKQAEQGLPPDAKAELDMALKQCQAGKDWLLCTMSQLVPVIRDPNILQTAQTVQQEIEATADYLLEALKKARVDPHQLQISRDTIHDFGIEIIQAASMTEARGLEGSVDFATQATLLSCALTDLRTALQEPLELLDLSSPEIIPGPKVMEAQKLDTFVLHEMEKIKSLPPDQADFENQMNSLRESVAKQAVSPTELRSDPLSILIKSCSGALDSLNVAVDVVTDASDDMSKQRLKKAKTNLKEDLSLLELYAEELRDNPTSTVYLGKVANTVGRLEGLTQQLVTDAGEKSAQSDLRFNAKTTFAKAKALIVHAKRCEPFVYDINIKTEMQNAIELVQSGMPGMLIALQNASICPEDMQAQLDLLTQAQWLTQQYANLTTIGAQYSSYLQNEPLKITLLESADKLYVSNTALWKSCNAVAAIAGEAKIETAIEDIEAIKVDLDTAAFAASQGLLKAIPGQTREEAIEIIQNSTTTLTNDLSQLISSAKQGQPVAEYCSLITECAQELGKVAQGTRILASTVVDREQQRRIIGFGLEVHEKAVNTISIARVIASNYDYLNNPKKLNNLDLSNTAYTEAVKTLLMSNEGLQGGNVDHALAAITMALEGLSKQNFGGRHIKLSEASVALASDTKALSAAVAQFSSIALKNPLALGSAAKMTGLTTAQLLSSAGVLAWATQDEATKASILNAARDLGDKMCTFLVDSKEVASGKTKQSVDKMKSSETAVKDSITDLLRTLGIASSQTTEESISSINAMVSLLTEEEGEDIVTMTPKILYDTFATSFRRMAAVSAELAKAAGSKNTTFPLGILSKDAMAAVEGVVDPTRIASKMAYKWTPLEAKLLKDARSIQEDPVNSKEVANWTKSIVSGSEQLKSDAEKYISAHPQDPRVEAIRQAEKQLTQATQQLQGAAKAQGADRNIAMIVQTGKEVGTRVRALALLTRDKPAPDDVLTTLFAEQLKEATRAATIAMTGQLRAAAATITYEDTEMTSKELSRATKTLANSLNDLIQITGALNPGVVACEVASKVIQQSSGTLDAAIIGLNFDGKFDPGAPVNKPLAQYQATAAKALKDVADALQQMTAKARAGDPEGLAVEVKRIEVHVPLFVKMALLTAAATPERDDQANILEMSKNLADSMVKLMATTKALNIYEESSVLKMDKAVTTASDAIGELLNEMQSGAQVASECESAVVTIKTHMAKLSETQRAPPTKKYFQCRVDLNNATKNLLGQGRRLLITDKTKGGEVGMILIATVEATEKFVLAANDIMAVTTNPEVKKAIKGSSQQAITELTKMISLTAQTIQGKDKNEEISGAFKNTNTCIGEVVSAVQRGDVAEQALETATKKINASIQQLNTTTIYAQTGQIEVTDPLFSGTTPTVLMGKLQNGIKQLEMEGGRLVETLNGTDDQFAKAALTVSDTASNISVQAIWSAAKQTDTMSQLDLLNAAKSLSSSLSQLLSSVKDARDRPDDGTKKKIVASAENGFKDGLNEVIQASQSTGTGMAKAEKELEATKQAIMSLLTDIPVYDTVTPEDLVKASREVMAVMSQLRFASTQDEIIEAGKKVGAGTEKMVKVANTISVKLALDPMVAQKILDAAKKGATTTINLLEASKLSRQESTTASKLEQNSDSVTVAITELIGTLKLLPDTADLQLEGEDYEKKAEEELKKCSEFVGKSKLSLEETKSKLYASSEEEKVAVDINLALLTATAAIADATQKLVTTAEAAQVERCQSTNKRMIKYNADPSWANGLISATTQVTSAIQHLSKSANDAVEGKGHEALVSATRNVAQATAHLVQASKAKSNPTVAGKLITVAKLVANATAKLVEASNRANQMKNQSQEDDLSNLAATDETRVQELEQQMKILKLENELEKAKRQLARLKKRN